MAGAGRRTFTPGEVLTASNVMNYLQDQAVMNFAGTAARGSAIGTAVSEGMVSYLADSNVVQAYDGSAWNSLAYASAVVTPGLVPVAPTSVDKSGGTATANALGQVTFSGVTSLSLNGVFTSSYKHYRIVLNSYLSSGVDTLRLRTRNAGTDYGGTNAYYWVGYAGSYADTYYSKQTYSNGDTTSGLGYLGFEELDSARILEVYNPNVAVRTKITYTGAYTYSGVNVLASGSITHNQNVAFDGFTIYPTSQNITGNIQVFGYND